MENKINKIISKSFLKMADYLEKKDVLNDYTIGVTLLGSELGIDHIVKGAEEAKIKLNINIVLIGPKVKTTLPIFEAETESEAHKKLEDLFCKKEIDAAVTMHYNFPIGVSTIGRVTTPMGKDIFLATTTGTTSTNRIESMIKNTIYGNIVAKSCGIKKPTIGILNIEGAKETEKQLKKIKELGYDINFGISQRSDGGVFLRGNDLILGSCNVVVTDSLTGNLLMKVFSAFNSGGKEEVCGYGYGPGIGFSYENKIFIVSRASGENVIKNAIEYAYDTLKGNINKILKDEEEKLKKLKFEDFLKNNLKEKKQTATNDKVLEKEVVTAQISGIDIMELDNAVEFLKEKGIYSEAGMGCTGPIVMVNEAKEIIAIKYLKEGEFLS
ncbi:MAG: glycine/sarcosine/betaine reductase complex component C subunit alpha [Cetobacterium sp.]